MRSFPQSADFNVPSMMQQIEQYVKDHPASRRVDIVKALKLPESTVSMALGRLSILGKVTRIRLEVNKRGAVAWVAGNAPERKPQAFGRDGSPMQNTVKEWEPETRRDPLTAALFGPAQR